MSAQRGLIGMLLLLPFALAAHPVLLQGALAAALGPQAETSGAAGVSGGVAVRLRPAPIVLEARFREMAASAEPRMVGGVHVNARWPSSGPYLFGGFAHHHEADMAIATGHPVEHTLAIHPGITHRTGFSVGLGWDLPAPYAETPLLARVQPALRLEAVLLPGTEGPPVYVVAEVGLAFGVGRQ